MGGTLTQLFPPSPTFTEKNVPSLVGRVFLVSGGNAGIGLELVKILYSKGGTVYVAGRSPKSIATAIETINPLHPESPGHLKNLFLDLSVLSTIAACVSNFLAQESRLDVLFNNAGISQAPAGSTTTQGHEAHMSTNCLGPVLLTKLLLPILLSTARLSPRNRVRIVFTSSSIINAIGPPSGLALGELAPGHFSQDKARNYSASKAGDWFLASEFNKRVRGDGVVSVALSPGTLRTKGWDRAPWEMRTVMGLFMHEPKMGAYTELWAGLSPEVTGDDGGRFAIPWGRWHPSPKQQILESLRTEEEGGTGLAGRFCEWCEEQTKEYTGGVN